MLGFLRDNLKLIAVAAVCMALGLSAPAIGHGVHAQFAHNADKVDGKHAVGAKASINKRKGKLVATNKVGRLPNNIIRKAPNSAKLGGFTAAQMRSMPLLVQGAGGSGNATVDGSGVTLQAAGTGEMRFGFIVPPDHTDGTPLFADIVYRTHGPAACSWFIATSGLVGPNDGLSHNGAWTWPGNSGFSGPVNVPAGDANTFKLTFEWPFTSEPGKYVQFAVQRQGDNAGDSCGSVTVAGVQIRY